MQIKGESQAETFLKNPPRSFTAVLLHGSDLGKVRERSAAIARRVTDYPDDPFDVAIVTEADVAGDAGRLDDELSALSLMGGRRLVRLRLADERAEVARIAAAALVRHLAGDGGPGTFFLIEAPSLSRDSALRKAAEAAPACAVIPCYEDEPAPLKAMIRDALAAEGLSLTADALEVFAARLPGDRGVARSEIERLILYLGPRSGRAGDFDALEGFLGVEPEASLAQAAIDAFGGRPAAAQANLRRAAMETDAGVGAVRAMSTHLTRLRRVIAMHAGGAPLPSAARSAGVFWKNEREFLRQARGWSLSALDSAQADAFAAERACKETNAPAELLAERLALSVAGRANRLGV